MVKRKIIISEHDNIAALMEDDRAVEFIIHRGDMLLGDVYLATVENILPSIDAAFVNVGGDKMGFLHSSDVPGKGDLKDRLEPKQQLVVQIMKEPTGHKGPRVSTNISLPGRFLVMMPESKGISISRKIVDTAERSRLKSVVSLMKPPGIGVIIRTEALNQKDSDVTEDFETLLERWQNIVSMADTAKPPTLLYRDQDLLYRVIREAVTDDVQEIVVDSTFGQQRAQQLLQTWNMEKDVKVTQFQGSQPILIGSGVDKEIKQALQTKVPLPSGGYLYIQTTEALSVVDVNSGKFTSLQSQAETIKLTNLEACKEIARQLRLRNIGGMIIVDFIDMESRSHQLTILQSFENELAPDKSKPQIGQLSDLGLVELTRHRQGQALGEIFTKRCKNCHGTGHEIELFSWVRGNADSDRSSRHSRSKLPIRQGGRMQQVAKPNASLSNRRDRSAVSLSGASGKSAASNVNADNILLNVLPSSTKDNAVKEAATTKDKDLTLTEYYGNEMDRRLGVKLALGLKLAWLPLEINIILTRMNPKANDIVSLVHSIECQGESGKLNNEESDDSDKELFDDDPSTSEQSEDDNLDTDEEGDSNMPSGQDVDISAPAPDQPVAQVGQESPEKDMAYKAPKPSKRMVKPTDEDSAVDNASLLVTTVEPSVEKESLPNESLETTSPPEDASLAEDGNSLPAPKRRKTRSRISKKPGIKRV